MMDIGKDLQNAYEEGYKQGYEQGKKDALYMATEALKADRPRGEWIDEDGTYYANCSKCGYQMDTHVERGYFRYCPNCGADMRTTGGENDRHDKQK